MFPGYGCSYRMFLLFDVVSPTGTGVPETYGIDQVSVCNSAGKYQKKWVFVHRSKSPHVLLRRTEPKRLWLKKKRVGSLHRSTGKDLKPNKPLAMHVFICLFPCQRPSAALWKNPCFLGNARWLFNVVREQRMTKILFSPLLLCNDIKYINTTRLLSLLYNCVAFFSSTNTSR